MIALRSCLQGQIHETVNTIFRKIHELLPKLPQYDDLSHLWWGFNSLFLLKDLTRMFWAKDNEQKLFYKITAG